MLTSAVGQPSLVRSTSRQCCSWLIRSRAGNQYAACESPNSTTVVVDVVSPYTHGLLMRPVRDRWQPFLTMIGSAAPAAARGGSRPPGACVILAPAARSVASWVVVSPGSAVRSSEDAPALEAAGSARATIARTVAPT